MSASLGGLIKDYRVQKNLSQLEIAFALGWKEPSRLSRIEQGRVSNPPRELIDRIIEVMDLKEEEKNHLLLIGNYLPTQEEIEKIRKEVNPIINNWPYPAYVLDFSWRFLAWNERTSWVYEITEKAKPQIIKNMNRTIEMVFNPQFIQNRLLDGKELEKWHESLLQKLILFKFNQQARTKELWYRDFISQMMDNELFTHLWPKARLSKEIAELDKYERKSIVNIRNTKSRLEFHIFKVPLLLDPRFEIDFHVPTNQNTHAQFKNSKHGKNLPP
ncbi:hypothetical protein A2982_02390 [candidate division WWE3 bacterium RIFCSPLOWO2_01_FULL_39_13]|uniref:HTH cro/C1-type domain-containing protein n=1 Tax=candidate division WWE3 bacterium RIFCSPLOWO2_01_FULL_39_13 TaxID=1802624 RepID=A0A1F4V1K9_UNCKA|nr:MAG: hypothetical protein A2982_02390 [candidate division WWE3 bacterium RIFCSPLOWO2_01_FULL_39_13]